jgi:hypothetical protein
MSGLGYLLKWQVPWRWLLFHKAVVLVVVFVASFLWPLSELDGFHHYLHWPPDAPGPTRLSTFAAWDGAHYLKIATTGYEKGWATCAFYPLWPGLIRAASAVTRLNPALVGLLLANVLSLAGFAVFYRLADEFHGRRMANVSLLLLLASPGALFFNVIYTESLFLLLISLFFLFLLRGHYGRAAAVGFFLPLTKAVGIFCLAPFAWELLRSKAESRKQKTEMTAGKSAISNQPSAVDFAAFAPSCGNPELASSQSAMAGNSQLATHNSQIVWRRFAWLLVPLLGYATYFFIMYQSTGNPWEGFDAQRFFVNHPSLKNIVNFSAAWHSLLDCRSFHAMLTSVLDRSFLILFLGSLPFIWRLNRSYFWYALLAGLVPALSMWFLSYTRHVMACLPLFIALGQALQAPARRWLLAYYVALMAGIQIVLFARFLTFDWAG